MEFSISKKLLEESEALFPGGVNSPVRSFRSVGTNPPFLSRGKGAYVIDEDGNQYLDYVLSWGPLILGHAHKEVVKDIAMQASLGTSFGAPTRIESQLAQKIQRFFPGMEKMRMVSSGTEATMSALRLARGHTGKRKIIKFDGCYHGHGDSLLVQMGSGGLTHGTPNSPGVLEDLAQHTLVAQFNDLDSVEQLFKAYSDDIAAIIVEPVPGNMGVIVPKQDFLQGMRDLCDKYSSVLIFDEVMSGWRAHRGGATQRYGVDPDLICLGKVVGGGLPAGVYGGKAEIMDSLSPLGPVYQAGTLSGNPLAMRAGLTTLEILDELEPFETMEEYARGLGRAMLDIAKERGVSATVNQVGSMFCFFFTEGPVETKADVDQCDFELFSTVFRKMLNKGVYIAPSQYEASFLSICHQREEFDRTLEAFQASLKEI